MVSTSTSGAPGTSRVIQAVVVDDDERLLAVIKRGLQLHGFEVTTFAEPQAALDYLDARPADVVVLDVMMPDLDGVSLCRRLRQTQSVPILNSATPAAALTTKQTLRWAPPMYSRSIVHSSRQSGSMTIRPSPSGRTFAGRPPALARHPGS